MAASTAKIGDASDAAMSAELRPHRSKLASASSGISLVMLAPGLFALAFVLTVYADFGAALESLPRPLAVAGAGVVAVQTVATILLRGRIRGALATMLLVSGIVSPMLLVILLLVAATLVGFSRWRGFSAVPLISGAATAVAILLVIAADRVAVSPAFDLADLLRGAPRISAVAAGE